MKKDLREILVWQENYAGSDYYQTKESKDIFGNTLTKYFSSANLVTKIGFVLTVKPALIN